MKILITGIGITGKSSFRRILVGKLREMGVGVAQYDADEFKELRHQADAGCEKPEEFWKGVVYVIEDIHGPEEDKSCLPLRDYDLILYLLPSKTSHAVFWFSRMWRWFQSGQFSWKKGFGWKGTGKPYDYRNILPIIKALLRDFKNRETWISDDLKSISPFTHLLIQSRWTRKGIRFSF